MPFLPILLWSDLLIWLLLAAGGLLAWGIARNPPLRSAWVRVGQSRTGMASATVLLVFILIGLVDSLHYRPRLESRPGAALQANNQAAAYGVEVLSLLDSALSALRTRNEKTYSEPLATRAYGKEMLEQKGSDGVVRQVQDFPRLKFGGSHLGDREGDRDADVGRRLLAALGLAVLAWWAIAAAVAAGLARCLGSGHRAAWQRIWGGGTGERGFAWDAVLVTLAGLFLAVAPLLALAPEYHVFGTDKVGQDVLYQVLKSIRTALIIGLVTTLVMLPFAVLLGIAAGYFRGWVDDLIQYGYT
ncbi:MAG: ABC transporter permease, partial [Betaproteobacteria bacterium]|nr:ABC transporter permease [Betaproteobacteria bacterium]